MRVHHPIDWYLLIFKPLQPNQSQAFLADAIDKHPFAQNVILMTDSQSNHAANLEGRVFRRARCTCSKGRFIVHRLVALQSQLAVLILVIPGHCKWPAVLNNDNE